MAKTKDRVIIDTNLWISFLLTKDFAAIDKLFANQSVTLLFSQELLEEFIEVAQRPKFKKYFSRKELYEILQWLSLHAKFIAVTTLADACRDQKDNFLLSLAADGKATSLLTGDKDLLALKTTEKQRSSLSLLTSPFNKKTIYKKRLKAEPCYHCLAIKLCQVSFVSLLLLRMSLA
ncbi:MAG: putative toxin-antitoxin system toxin component, PIN family [Chitinophagaceae bacterium]|nr:MAG: putative toxin-antitoxin system toxin component, PIN family [Chitinophagaceae bacterium]